MAPKGRLLIIGGAEDKGDEHDSLVTREKNIAFQDFEILKKLLPANTSKKSSIVVVTTASKVPAEVKRKYEASFKKIGFSNAHFINATTREEAHNLEFLDRIEEAGTVMFSGGDQLRLMTILGGTPLIAAIYERYQNDAGFTVAGTSAGAMIMPHVTIYEEKNHEALLKGDVKVGGGFGFMDGSIVDTHFIKRGRFARLAHAVLMNPSCFGIGLGEDTMMEIINGEEALVLGSGMVVIIDGQGIRKTNIMDAESHEPVYVEDLNVHLLVRGCRFNIIQRKFKGVDEKLLLKRMDPEHQ